MSKPQKILTFALWIVAAMALAGVAGMRLTHMTPQSGAGTTLPSGDNVDEIPVLYPAPNFTLTDQNGNSFDKTKLLGHYWLADFIFTTCPNLCPIMSQRMEDLQGRLPTDVKLVSFSVDPEHDTPAALAVYAAQHHAQDGRWTFLTGKLADVSAVVSGMKTSFTPATSTDPLTHSPYFILVDDKGMIRRYYDSNDSDTPGEVVKDINRLLAKPVK